LTYDDFERVSNAEVICSKVAEKIKPDTNVDSEILKKRREAVVWRLLFFVGVGRITGRDIHTIRRTRISSRQPVQYTETQLKHLRKGEPVFVQFNYLAIINNLLFRDKNFICKIKSVIQWGNADEEKDVEKLFEEYFGGNTEGKNGNWSSDNMFKMLSLSCIDVLDALIQEMNLKADSRTIEPGGTIADELEDELMWGAGSLNQLLETTLREIYERTKIGANENEMKEKIGDNKEILGNSPFSKKIDPVEFREAWGM